MSRTTHGMSGTSEYKAWKSMRSRCLCENSTRYNVFTVGKE